MAKIGISDHFPTIKSIIIAVFKDSVDTKHFHATDKYRCYKYFDNDKFLNDLEDVQWELLEYFKIIFSDK